MRNMTFTFTHPSGPGASAFVSVSGTTLIGAEVQANSSLSVDFVDIPPGIYIVSVMVTTLAGTSWTIAVSVDGNSLPPKSGIDSGGASFSVTL